MVRFRDKAKRVTSTMLDSACPGLLTRYYLYTKSRHFEPEMWLVPSLISRKGVALDVGANAGHWSLQLARYSRHVHAFEPNPICLSRLVRLLPSCVSLHPIALSDRAGTATLRYDPENT